jgi:hypothetical protein
MIIGGLLCSRTRGMRIIRIRAAGAVRMDMSRRGGPEAGRWERSLDFNNEEAR